MFRPDIVVMAPGTPEMALIAEVKSRLPDLLALESQLKAYMLSQRCAVALIVTPERTWIYRDTYKDYTPTSIERAGDFKTADLLSLLPVPTDERALADFVGRWLEALTLAWPNAVPDDPEPRRLVQEILLPAVAEGRVLAGGPREASVRE